MPELEKSFQRQIAYKIKISDILNSSFAKDEISAGHIKINNNAVSRVNVIATIVHMSGEGSNYKGAVVDDGTGNIMLRSFENQAIFSKVEVGDNVLFVGKIREFGNERYIIPEILKKISDIGWMHLRKIELKKSNAPENKALGAASAAAAEEATTNFNDGIYLLIKKLDVGDGVQIEEVIKNSSSNNTEEIINRLLENGDIFEITPGRIKVLE